MAIPQISGTTLLSTPSGARAVVVSIPRRTYIDHNDPWRQVSIVRATGPYAGFAIHDLVSRRRVFALIQPFAACRAWRCDPAMGAEALMVTMPGSRNAGPPDKLVLPPGRYALFALAAPGHSATLRVKFPGLPGTARLTASRSVHIRYREVVKQSVLADQLTGTLGGSLRGNGFVLGTLWATPLEIETQPTGEVLWANMRQMFSCIERGAKESQAPTPCDPPGTPNDEEGEGIVIGASGTGALGGRGRYSFSFGMVAAGRPQMRVGAYALWFTFLS